MLKEINEENECIQNTMFPYIENGIDSLLEKMPDLTKYNNIDVNKMNITFDLNVPLLLYSYNVIAKSVLIVNEKKNESIYHKKSIVVCFITIP